MNLKTDGKNEEIKREENKLKNIILNHIQTAPVTEYGCCDSVVKLAVSYVLSVGRSVCPWALSSSVQFQRTPRRGGGGGALVSGLVLAGGVI